MRIAGNGVRWGFPELLRGYHFDNVSDWRTLAATLSHMSACLELMGQARPCETASEERTPPFLQKSGIEAGTPRCWRLVPTRQKKRFRLFLHLPAG